MTIISTKSLSEVLDENGLQQSTESYYTSTDNKSKLGFYGNIPLDEEYLYNYCKEEQRKEIDEKWNNDEDIKWLDYVSENTFNNCVALNVAYVIKEQLLSQLGIDFNDVYDLAEESKLKCTRVWTGDTGSLWLVELN